MKARIFISGTDTGVGKTVVARAIARALVRRGLAVSVAKPVESGTELIDGQQVPTDALSLIRASGSTETLDAVCRYRFPDPVSPHLAAARVGTRIDPEAILASLKRLEAQADVLIAEGAGGLLVPLSDELLYADVISRIGYRLVIVAPNVLGAINATLLTIEAARSRRIDLLGVIFNQTPPADLGNSAAVASHGRVPILGELPTCKDPEDDDALADLAEQHIELSALVGCGYKPISGTAQRQLR